MDVQCENSRQFLLQNGCEPEFIAAARRALDHLDNCEQCRSAAADFARLSAILAPTNPTPEPAGGWSAFEERIAAAAAKPPAPALAKKFRPLFRIAAAVAILLTGAAVIYALRDKPIQPSINPIAKAPEMSDAMVTKLFSTVAADFDGKTSWVMLSDHDSNLGLTTDAPAKITKLLIVRLNLEQGDANVSQINLAIVPGQTARFSVPAKSGHKLDYIITTDAVNNQHVDVRMVLSDPKNADEKSQLGTLATAVDLPVGKDTRTGRLLTREGTFDLSLSVQSSNLTASESKS